MTRAMQLVHEVAEFCDWHNFRLPVRVFAAILNAAGMRTSYGTPYKGGGGRTYRRLERKPHPGRGTV